MELSSLMRSPKVVLSIIFFQGSASARRLFFAILPFLQLLALFQRTCLCTPPRSMSDWQDWDCFCGAENQLKLLCGIMGLKIEAPLSIL
jgi:hypothetical protein